MTMTALVVLMTALATDEGGRTASRPASPDMPAVTCTLRVVSVQPTFDAGILAPVPRRAADAVVADDPMVRDSVSPCGGTTTLRAARPRLRRR
jgi:hypothetical protein